MWESTAKNDPVNAEMLAIGARFDAPERWIRQDGKRVDLTPQQYDRYSELAGKGTRRRIEAMMADPGWSSLSREKRAKLASEAAKSAKSEARAMLFGKPMPSTFGPRNAPRKPAIPPPPRGFTIEGEAGGRNVYADLQQAIPGAQFGSGFRTPEYQADMRRRGYRPAWNSEHLDGSSLDMLPPKGKTLGWLEAQVRRYDPKARTLIHDGHLHATFPGYFGAPPLGGAQAAGLRNPNAGMPPPPPGFKLDR
jgi:hypothetical protein